MAGAACGGAIAALKWGSNRSRQLQQRLSAVEAERRLLAEHAADVIIVIDQGGQVRWVSPAVTAILGWRAEEWVGSSLDDLLTDEAGGMAAGRAAWTAADEAAGPLRIRVRHRAGDLHTAEVICRSRKAALPGIDGVVVAVRLVDAEEAVRTDLERRAETDELTGLTNRRGAVARIQSLIAQARPLLAVLWCDVDGLKLVNDTHGHAAGDEVLRQLAERIRRGLRRSDDLAARMGGDELIAVVRGVASLEIARRLAERIRRAAEVPVTTAGGPVAITLSIGATLARPFEPVDQVLARADRAMYRAKHDGGNRVVVSSSDDDIRADAGSGA